MSGRRQNTPREYPNSRGSPRTYRDSARAARYEDDRTFREDWTQEEKSDNRRYQNKPRSTPRSSTWVNKKKGSSKPPTEQFSNLRATEETPPMDEPMYDLGPHSGGVAANEIFQQNFELSGFESMCDETYRTLQGIDPRLARRMPYCGFLHAYNTLAYTAAIDSVFENRERPIDGCTEMAQTIIPEDFYVPGPIAEYLTNVSNIVTPDSDQVRVNLPQICIPQGPLVVDGVDIPSGTFGPVNAESHNAYETYISPRITQTRIESTAQDHIPQNWQPLPQALIPQGAEPTHDLLGYGPLEILTPEGKSSIRGLNFRTGNDLEGRLCYSAELMLRVSRIMQDMSTKFKMVKLGTQTSQPFIKRKTAASNLLYVEASQGNGPLRNRQVSIHSRSGFGSSQAGQSNVTVMHRRRTVQYPGLCYLINNVPPDGWILSRNHNFLMLDPYAPTMGIDLPELRTSRFTSATPAGSRLTALACYIKRNYSIEDKR